MTDRESDSASPENEINSPATANMWPLGATMRKQIAVVAPGVFRSVRQDRQLVPRTLRGYPESNFIHFENEAHSTREEARDAAAELRRMGARRVLLVTSNFHTRRAMRMYHEEAPDMEIITVAAADEYFSPHGWWKNR